MKFYDFLRGVAVAIIWTINGRITYMNRDKLPKDDNYVLVGPHRTWWDPVWYAVAAYPKHFIFMAKIELFKFKPLAWLIKSAGAFPVDRENVGPSVIKYPVRELKSGQRSLIMFPSGSRHSDDLKSGSLLIARMAGKPIVPAVYQGPVKFSHLFKRHNTTINFGEPIYIDRADKLNAENIAKYTDIMQSAFDKLDDEINPDWHYIDPKRIQKK
ncbi:MULTISPECIES: lysophospholipid acyltransferase family protein [Leuconostoc]|jgi:1-acyl-sn-glycerol-3-phosphate acyltransferase|uniref:lysophospholipid acyltransferase family protein n=1 Tax=Leuconostoc TaxID=1243 RepID=UPI00112050E9|nr:MULTISPECIES: 1-acyl-sn-glycerol-3-phosphate acyltransferase [Leuconostoc]MBK0039910.1 1-acyl-sn-glycerol-3-phosphate acyltransferase [Leuconostoc sp. S51]MBK0050869.1 1-acyl-sn-glycerol-3-phosphate acyltransferase [Leuconostoc sp. S50]MCC7668138.1 1-acyl-sn-glycerol-3-phosphate acyltransferase [Leuconostoc pseudomesenteroides]MCT4387956.1 1-acyl-sn-glycerol-3-phosphate acyltransferase [Leuconostoc pseudomesenteroides]TOZ07050.1 1-acyl-sn-glycerol-3-phosphate acyltransferase [Leuconostoc ps